MLAVSPEICTDPSEPPHVVGLKKVSMLNVGSAGSVNVNVPAGIEVQPLGAVTVRLV